MLSNLYMKIYTSSDNKEHIFMTIEDYLDEHPDSYQYGHSDFVYEKTNGEFTILY